MAQSGFLLIADITGYTMFLTRSELEHAQGILDALFKSIFAEIKAPIILSNLQGDAALTYLPDTNLPQRVARELRALARECKADFEIHDGDAFLLCSDGLTRAVSQTDISVWMAHPDINEAVGGLIRTTLNAGAPDNVTVVIAEVRRDTVSGAGVST